MTVETRDFHFEEYKHLKAEISSLLDRVTTIIQFILGAMAAVYAWLLTNGGNVSKGMYIPFMLAMFATAMVYQIVRRIHGMRRYLLILESYLHNSAPPLVRSSGKGVTGWEQFRALDPSSGGWESIAVYFLAGVSLVALLLAFVVAIGWVPIEASHEVTVHCPGG
jgi:hypothetical protein